MNLLIRLERREDFLRKNDYFRTCIISQEIFGGIANLLLSSRAASADMSSFLGLKILFGRIFLIWQNVRVFLLTIVCHYSL